MSCHGPRLLVVDDEAPIRIVVAAMLRRSGFTVETADDGEAALALLDTHSFDLLLLDLKMPGMDGMEVARRALSLVPKIIIFTGHGAIDSLPEDLAQSIDVLHKTASPEEVVERIQLTLSHLS